VPFEQIAPIVDRSPDAARQLASRARRRVRGERALPDADLARQREIVGAFLAAARNGDFDALVSLLDPDVVVRVDFGAAGIGMVREVRGAEAAARQALTYSPLGLVTKTALVNGVVGAVSVKDGLVYSVGAITVRGDRIVALDILADPERLRRLDLAALED
jgi:ketosteroid isomerase-like protein